MKDFNVLRANDQLQNLAGNPYDLTYADALTAERLETFKTSMCGFDLLYAMQRVDEEVLIALQDLADEAGLVETLAEMQAGAVLNRIEGYPSENRQVLHTACRDVFTESPMAGDASARARQELRKLESFLDELADGTVVNQAGQPFTTMVQVGIGGSDLGPGPSVWH